MKKKYVQMEAVLIPFDSKGVFNAMSSKCFEIIANNVIPGTRVCQNPDDNTSYKWYGDNPYE